MLVAHTYKWFQLAQELGMSGWLREGVYAMVGGPNYETNAEVNIYHKGSVH